MSIMHSPLSKLNKRKCSRFEQNGHRPQKSPHRILGFKGDALYLMGCPAFPSVQASLMARCIGNFLHQATPRIAPAEKHSLTKEAPHREIAPVAQHHYTTPVPTAATATAPKTAPLSNTNVQTVAPKSSHMRSKNPL